ncbi:transmembrane protein UsgS [Talaromyces proteolyticus]|uniref:Transmembrane protein UsgS n=1 Tax=Talaromyces proteolyticus TaxID=1131652 RepID=A0AAD4L456_9EURO|nr:transmembrane protein UsgS [Talaromyces proteolyticus]KAH8703227.1 transmembrane protein UsgS [Talaromyces proteolyticus]
MSSFEPNAIVRGAQLTVVGTLRALRNPQLFQHEHFRQAALAVVGGIVIQLIVQIPIIIIKLFIWMASWVSDLDRATWDDEVIGGLNFLSNSVLQVPFLLMTLMRYITPTLDDIFMLSLKWVDRTYIEKHETENPHHLRAMYYQNLASYPTKRGSGSKSKKPTTEALLAFFRRYARKVGMWVGIYALSLLPVVGRFVMPAASFYTVKKSIGTVPAAVIFGSGIILPKRYIVLFLHTYYASRSLMRELLDPYFSRIKFDKDQKRKWFRDREGVLFGFAFAFTVVLKTPFIGVLMYGIAQASTAYLVTKITDPPPAPEKSEGFAQSQVAWTNKHDFLQLSLDKLDKFNIKPEEAQQVSVDTGLAPSPGKKFS